MTTLPLSRSVAAHPRRLFLSESMHLRQRRRMVNYLMIGLAALVTALVLVPLFWIVGYVFIKGSQSLTPAFFTRLPTPVGVPGGGVLHAIQGTLLLITLGGLFAVPPGLLAAVYVAYYPNTPLGTLVRFSTDVLSGVPSIIIGLMGYGLIVRNMGTYSALAGGVVMAVLMLPIVIRTTEEMIKLVPGSLREASLGLGAREWRTSVSVVLPAALNGIATGILLGLARVSGETAPLLFTALGNENFEITRVVSGGLALGRGPLEIIWSVLSQPVDSLPLTLYKYATQPFQERIEQSWAVAVILMGLVLMTNIIARVWIQARVTRQGGR